MWWNGMKWNGKVYNKILLFGFAKNQWNGMEPNGTNSILYHSIGMSILDNPK
jgi:hypothetical protein